VAMQKRTRKKGAWRPACDPAPASTRRAPAAGRPRGATRWPRDRPDGRLPRADPCAEAAALCDGLGCVLLACLGGSMHDKCSGGSRPPPEGPMSGPSQE
jgi:hypothetical protein